MRRLPFQATAFGVLYMLLLGWGVGFCLIHSLDWPILHDGAILQYLAWRILGGAVPYADLFDMEMPGAYLPYMACQWLFGPGDLAFRLFDLFFCLLAAAGILCLSWRQSKLYGCVGALLFTLAHLSHGVVSLGQRDFLMVPFLLFAAWLLRMLLENPHKLIYAMGYGVLAACAFWIKPVAIFFILMSMLAVLFLAIPLKTRITANAAIAAGALVPAMFIHIWLIKTGALFAFYDTFLHFTLPVYGQVQILPANSIFFGFLLARLAGLTMMLIVLYRYTATRSADKTVVSIGLLYGLTHFYVQNKGFTYHYYPLWAFTALYAAMSLPYLRFKKPAEQLIIYMIALTGCLSLLPSPDMSDNGLGPAMGRQMSTYLSTVAKDAGEALQAVPEPIRSAYVSRYPHQEIQFFDMSKAELWNAAFRQHWIPPTRQMHPFPFYHGGVWEKPEMIALRNELLEQLLEKKPLVIAMPSETFPNVDGKLYHDLDTLPPWNAFFADYYRLIKQTPSYRMYARSN